MKGPSGRPGGPFFLPEQRDSAEAMKIVVVLAIALTACRDAQPPLPTPDQTAQLDEAEAMLNAEENRVDKD